MCRPKLTLKTLPVSKPVLVNRKADHTCTGIQYENFEYPESFINHYYRVKIDFFLIRSSNERQHVQGSDEPKSICTCGKRGGGMGGCMKIYQKLKLLPPFLVPGIKKSNKILQF